MKKIISIFFLLFSFFVIGQNEQLAQYYYESGEFEKAASLYKEMYQTSRSFNYNYFQKYIVCLQQLKKFELVDSLFEELERKNNNPTFIIEKGYNKQLQKKQPEADKYFEKAIEAVEKNPNYAYTIAQAFEQKSLLLWAYKAYETAQKLNSSLNFDYQMALLQGQMGNIEQMVNKLLDYGFSNYTTTLSIQNQFSLFLKEDSEDKLLNYLKKELILRSQKTQDLYWNQFLSWLYINQKEYNKAFIQERAIYKRNPESFDNIIELAKLCVQNQELESAQEIFTFIVDNTSDEETLIFAKTFVLKYEIEKNNSDTNALKSKIDLLMKEYKSSPYSLDLQLLAAHFYTFKLNQLDYSKEIVSVLLEKNKSNRQQAKIKMELADCLVFAEQFNQAILNYAQIENDLPNDEMAYEANLKMAKTSFFKKDFDWSMKQAKELKQATSQLIANDAVELFLLISDNSEDSLRVALQDFSKAELLSYQNKFKEAIDSYTAILNKHKESSIIPGTLYKIGFLYQNAGDYIKALNYYDLILNNQKDCIYIDEALFYSAEINNKFLNAPEKAKIYYEQLVLQHPDSIFFPEARRQYRLLRGEKLEGLN